MEERNSAAMWGDAGRQRRGHRASGQRGKPARSREWTGAAPPRAKSGGRPREPAGAQPRVGGRGRRPLPPRRPPPWKVMRGRQASQPWPVVAGDRRGLLAATSALPRSGQPRDPGGEGAPGQPAVHAAAFAPPLRSPACKLNLARLPAAMERGGRPSAPPAGRPPRWREWRRDGGVGVLPSCVKHPGSEKRPPSLPRGGQERRNWPPRGWAAPRQRSRPAITAG